ncbi:hypothetical protein TRAPUB_4704 [Trametes pubescens]|uniref:DUF6535 domain-containing protein n=1 Tax=Trametes pubescens TaxID=154538 RepID=A0A1M2VAI8_TRAPU|nr:hypothetical protein TRAPUB_4704 [Trametes pubescens]
MVDNAHGSHGVGEDEQREDVLVERSAGTAPPPPIVPGSTENNPGRPSSNETNAPRSNAGVRQDEFLETIQEERLVKEELELEELLQQRKAIRTEEQQAKAWTDAAKAVKLYSDNMIHRWNKEIDVYLVFAALFSAILTAFNVESYRLLRLSPDNTAVALERISMQLQSFSISPPFVNATHSALSDVASIVLDTSSAIPEYAVKLNTLWFSGLILSLASTVIGILLKQWMGEYNNGLTGTSRGVARRRQYRLNNLVKWRVGYIIALIPILLLISLTLFLAGLLVLIWELHPTVARVASILVVVVAGSTTAVTLLLLCASDCAYLPHKRNSFSISGGVRFILPFGWCSHP